MRPLNVVRDETRTLARHLQGSFGHRAEPSSGESRRVEPGSGASRNKDKSVAIALNGFPYVLMQTAGHEKIVSLASNPSLADRPTTHCISDHQLASRGKCLISVASVDTSRYDILVYGKPNGTECRVKTRSSRSN